MSVVVLSWIGDGRSVASLRHCRHVAGTTDQVMAPVDREMVNMLHAHMRDKGIDSRLKTGLSAITAADFYPAEPEFDRKKDKPDECAFGKPGFRCLCGSGDQLQTDMVISLSGWNLETTLAVQGSGAGGFGGIKANTAMQNIGSGYLRGR